MGMTLWLHTLEERNYSRDSDDYSLLHRYSDELDEACTQIGVPMLSSFFDSTDLEYNYADEDDEDEHDEPDLDDAREKEAGPALDPETGLAYGIEDMEWFAIADGLKTLSKLRTHLESGGLSQLTPDHRSGLIDELNSCIGILEKSARRGGKFHLAIIE